MSQMRDAKADALLRRLSAPAGSPPPAADLPHTINLSTASPRPPLFLLAGRGRSTDEYLSAFTDAGSGSRRHMTVEDLRVLWFDFGR